jgi:hypothetical protein
MVMSDQLHAVAVFSLAKEPLVPNEGAWVGPRAIVGALDISCL